MQRTFNEKADVEAFAIREEDGTYRRALEDEILAAARTLVEARFSKGASLTSPRETKDFLKLRLAASEREVFAVLWLDNRHRVIAFEELFRGTIDGCSVYPRELVKSALKHNAAACVLCHNHPSGVAEPSNADRIITRKIREALDLVEVRTLDHVIVAEETCSFAELGLL